MPSPVMTHTFAYAAATDAGNRSMRKAGRTVWSEEDYDAAIAEYHRVFPQVEVTPNAVEPGHFYGRVEALGFAGKHAAGLPTPGGTVEDDIEQARRARKGSSQCI